MYVYVSQGKNEPHFNKNISATAFINSCQHLPNIYTKDLDKNFKGLATCFTKIADCFGWFALLVVLLFFLLYNELFQRKNNWGHNSFFEKPP